MQAYCKTLWPLTQKVSVRVPIKQITYMYFTEHVWKHWLQVNKIMKFSDVMKP